MMAAGVLLAYVPLVLLAAWGRLPLAVADPTQRVAAGRGARHRRSRIGDGVGPPPAPDASQGGGDFDGRAAAASGDPCWLCDWPDRGRVRGSCTRRLPAGPRPSGRTPLAGSRWGEQACARNQHLVNSAASPSEGDDKEPIVYHVGRRIRGPQSALLRAGVGITRCAGAPPRPPLTPG